MGDAGVGSVLAVAEWHANVAGEPSRLLVSAFRKRYPDPRDDYLHARMQSMIEMLVQAMERARSVDPVAVAHALEGARLDAAALGGVHEGRMRADDHQFQQPMVVMQMDRVGSAGVVFDVEGSGYGFRTLRRYDQDQMTMAHTCRMARPQ